MVISISKLCILVIPLVFSSHLTGALCSLIYVQIRVEQNQNTVRNVVAYYGILFHRGSHIVANLDTVIQYLYAPYLVSEAMWDNSNAGV